MRTLEHRRHSRREPGEHHLSAAGRELARAVGASLPRFDRVVTSPKPRAFETVEAMGLRVDAEVALLGQMPDDAGIPGDERMPRTFADTVAMVGRSEESAAYAESQSKMWRSELERVPEGGALLMISHGGIIEFGAAFAVPRFARSWGRWLGYLEGVRLTWDGSEWTSGAILRLRE
jgi:broad specificity phosphatase PhoE